MMKILIMMTLLLNSTLGLCDPQARVIVYTTDDDIGLFASTSRKVEKVLTAPVSPAVGLTAQTTKTAMSDVILIDKINKLGLMKGAGMVGANSGSAVTTAVAGTGGAAATAGGTTSVAVLLGTLGLYTGMGMGALKAGESFGNGIVYYDRKYNDSRILKGTEFVLKPAFWSIYQVQQKIESKNGSQ